MAWYSAHLAMYTMFTDGIQEPCLLREDIVLIEATTIPEAFGKAKIRGRQHEGDDGGTYSVGGRQATWVFLSVRKLIECDPPEQRPGDGTEISYSFFEAKNRADVQKFAKGEAVDIRCRD